MWVQTCSRWCLALVSLAKTARRVPGWGGQRRVLHRAGGEANPGREMLESWWLPGSQRLVTWWHLHALCAHGGGIRCFLCVNAGVSSGRVSPPAIPACPRVPLGEALPVTLGGQGHFSRVCFGRAGASRPALVAINSARALLCSASRASPKARLRGARSPARPYCRILQCSLDKGSPAAAQGRWEGRGGREVSRDALGSGGTAVE